MGDTGASSLIAFSAKRVHLLDQADKIKQNMFSCEKCRATHCSDFMLNMMSLYFLSISACSFLVLASESLMFDF